MTASIATLAVMSGLAVRTARTVLVDQHGEDAATEAAMEADAMLEKGAMAGAATWRRIVKAVEEVSPLVPKGTSTSMTC